MSNNTPEQNASEKFLTPEAMLTPGIAGAVVMAATATLHSQFAWPQNYTGLCLSLLAGLLVFKSKAASLVLRFVYWLLNSLIIFTVAMGADQARVVATTERAAPQIVEVASIEQAQQAEAAQPSVSTWLTTRPGRIYLDLPADQSSAAQPILNELKSRGYTIYVSKKPVGLHFRKTKVDYYYDEDQSEARSLTDLLSSQGAKQVEPPQKVKGSGRPRHFDLTIAFS